MATFLYRLGRFTARRAWLTLGVWVLLLGALAGLTASFAKPLTAEVTFPGAPFERVLEDLGREVPSAAGGMGTITVENEHGSITPEQREALDATIADWEALPQVLAVTDPFGAQQRLDDNAAQAAKGRAELSEGAADLDQGRAFLHVIEVERDKQAARLDRLTAAGSGATAEADRARAEIARLDTGYRSLSADLSEGDSRLDAASAELAQGERLLALSDGLRFVAEDGSAAVLQVQFTESVPAVSPDDRAEVVETGQQLADAGLRVDYDSNILQTRSILGVGEVIGLSVAAIVLVVMLGTLLAAGLPLLVALVGVGAGLLGAMAATALFEMNSMTPALALMLGLAVGIDYALFIISRHRQHLLEGMDVHHSIGLSNGTAGNAVVVAGATVVIALTALVVTGLPILAQLGLVAAGTVTLTVLAALTITPAVLALLGTRAVPRRTWRRHAAKLAADAEHTPHARGRWAELVTRRPWATIVLTVLALSVVAIPAASLRLGLPDGSSEPRDSSAFHSYVTIEEHFGPGSNGPIVAVATFEDPIAQAEVRGRQVQIGEDLKGLDGVRQVVPFGVSDDRDTLAFQLVPAEGPTSEATTRLVHNLRAFGETTAEEGYSLGLTGQTVANIDVAERLGAALPLYLAIVVGLSLVLLMMVFRSVLVPLIATGGFLLSLGAAFGSVVAVYQWGWLGAAFDVSRPGPILAFMPTLVVGILFGLAMDYQMFLVSGMHEAYAHGQDARTAVRTGFRHGYRVVTAAAIIMVSVFSGFVFAHLTMIRPIGLGLAVGVAVDAFLVRMTITPALMHLLGDRAWWMPGWLTKVLPDLDIEGRALERSAPQAAPAEEREPVGAGATGRG